MCCAEGAMLVAVTSTEDEERPPDGEGFAAVCGAGAAMAKPISAPNLAAG
jgi:hypothetical protein